MRAKLLAALLKRVFDSFLDFFGVIADVFLAGALSEERAVRGAHVAHDCEALPGAITHTYLVLVVDSNRVLCVSVIRVAELHHHCAARSSRRRRIEPIG